MKAFKVGDWVTLLDKWVHKVEAVSKNGRVLFLNTREIPQADNWWGIDQCTPWQPEIGDWCWFWNTQAQAPVLGKFLKYDGRLMPFFTMANDCFIFCEPFIGELPSHLKEDNNATN